PPLSPFRDTLIDNIPFIPTGGRVKIKEHQIEEITNKIPSEPRKRPLARSHWDSPKKKSESKVFNSAVTTPRGYQGKGSTAPRTGTSRVRTTSETGVTTVSNSTYIGKDTDTSLFPTTTEGTVELESPRDCKPAYDNFTKRSARLEAIADVSGPVSRTSSK